MNQNNIISQPHSLFLFGVITVDTWGIKNHNHTTTVSIVRDNLMRVSLREDYFIQRNTWNHLPVIETSGSPILDSASFTWGLAEIERQSVWSLHVRRHHRLDARRKHASLKCSPPSLSPKRSCDNWNGWVEWIFCLAIPSLSLMLPWQTIWCFSLSVTLKSSTFPLALSPLELSRVQGGPSKPLWNQHWQLEKCLNRRRNALHGRRCNELLQDVIVCNKSHM